MTKIAGGYIKIDYYDHPKLYQSGKKHLTTSDMKGMRNGRKSKEDDNRVEVKEMLWGHHLVQSDELKKFTQSTVASFKDTWFINFFNKWNHRDRECVASGGEYLEKVNRVLNFQHA